MARHHTPPTVLEGIVKWYVSQTSAAGCEGPRAPITAQIDYLASPSLSLSDSVVCRGGEILFNAKNTGDDMTGITWSFGDNHDINNTNPVEHAFNGTGTFTVTVTALYKVCPEEVVSKTVLVVPAPTVYLGSDTSICPGGNAILLADDINVGIPGVSWLWNTGETVRRSGLQLRACIM